MHAVQASGVLVLLSPVWIEELYQQVLLRNLLGDAGYQNQHTATLVSMLTGTFTHPDPS